MITPISIFISDEGFQYLPLKCPGQRLVGAKIFPKGFYVNSSILVDK